MATESNETNNYFSIPINITSSPTLLPDLAFISVNSNTSTSFPSGIVQTSYSFINNGTAATTGNGKIGVFLSDSNKWTSSANFLGFTNFIPLAPSSTVTDYLNIIIPNSTQTNIIKYLVFFADYQGLFTELDESNNVITIPIYISQNNTSISENQRETIVIYPNPTSNILKIKSSVSIHKKSFDIIDITGRIVKSGVIQLNQIEVSSIVKGVYFLRIDNTFMKFTKR